MSDESKSPRTWWLEPDYDGRHADEDDIYWGTALNYDPKQGPFDVQASRVKVIEYSAFEAMRAERDEAETCAECSAMLLDTSNRERDRLRAALAYAKIAMPSFAIWTSDERSRALLELERIERGEA